MFPTEQGQRFTVAPGQDGKVERGGRERRGGGERTYLDVPLVNSGVVKR